jgi:hypothetical protein
MYVERSMNIFIVHISIIRPKSHFDSTNIKASIVIIIINFNENFKMAHPTTLVIFYVPMFICQNFIYYTFITFLLKNSFFNDFLAISHIISKHGSYYVKQHGSIYFQLP